MDAKEAKRLSFLNKEKSRKEELERKFSNIMLLVENATKHGCTMLYNSYRLDTATESRLVELGYLVSNNEENNTSSISWGD